MRLLVSLVSLLALASPALAQSRVEFPTPSGWEKGPASGELRFAEFHPKGEPGPELVIFQFGGHGEVQAVINRWLSRIEQPDGSPSREAATLTRWTRDGMTLHLLDARGTRVPSPDHAAPGAPTERQPNWRLLAGALEGPGGPYFLRLEGPQAQLTELANGFFEVAFGARAAMAAPAAAGKKPRSVAAKGMLFRPQPGWEVIQPRSMMRAAEFHLPVDGGPSLQIIVFHFGPGGGGKTEDNLQRWIAQFTLPDGSPAHHAAKVEKKTLPNDVGLTILSLSGTLVGGSAPGEKVNQPGQRMLAAIIECPGGPFFMKVVGAEQAVRSHEDSIRRFLDELDPIR